ncbi:MAG: tetratricopeptide repeat protein [Myxococcota bacterium]
MRGLSRAGLLLGLLTLMGSSPPADAPKRGGGGEISGKRKPGPGQPRARKGGREGKAGGKGGAEGEGGKGKAGGMRAARGNMFLRQGSPRAAVASFRKQLETSPDSTALHIGLGKALARMGRCEEALDHLWPYVGTLPFGADAAISASTCSSRMGLLDDAIYFDRIAVDLDPTSARALTNLALDLSTAGDEAGAAEALDELLFLWPERDASSYARAVLALRGGDLDTFDLVVEAWERNDGPSLDLRRLQAQAWLDMDNPPAAMAALENVRRMRNGQQVRHIRSEALRRMGYTAEAAGFLEDRPQSVLEGVDSDAVRVRVHSDQRDFAAAHLVLDGYDVIDDPELIASAWYLASAEGRTDALPALQADYEHTRTSPLRQLSHLLPWTARKD